MVRASHHKHPGFSLDKKLYFKQHIDLENKQKYTCNKKTRPSLPRKPLMKIYKAFLKPLIDYGDIIYDQPQNESFCVN